MDSATDRATYDFLKVIPAEEGITDLDGGRGTLNFGHIVERGCRI